MRPRRCARRAIPERDFLPVGRREMSNWAVVAVLESGSGVGEGDGEG